MKKKSTTPPRQPAQSQQLSHASLSPRAAGMDLPGLTHRLRKGSRKVTGQREAILNILRRLKRPLTIKEIFSELGQCDCNVATVYRLMNLLEEIQMVKRFDFGDGTARFELLAEGDDGHHHHLVCTQCRRIVEIEDCFPRELEAQIAKAHGFVSVTHNLEFFGICSSCR